MIMSTLRNYFVTLACLGASLCSSQANASQLDLFQLTDVAIIYDSINIITPGGIFPSGPLTVSLDTRKGSFLRVDEASQMSQLTSYLKVTAPAFSSLTGGQPIYIESFEQGQYFLVPSPDLFQDTLLVNMLGGPLDLKNEQGGAVGKGSTGGSTGGGNYWFSSSSLFRYGQPIDIPIGTLLSGGIQDPTISLTFGGNTYTTSGTGTFYMESVPGPLSILGVGATFNVSRKIRHKIKLGQRVA